MDSCFPNLEVLWLLTKLVLKSNYFTQNITNKNQLAYEDPLPTTTVHVQKSILNHWQTLNS